MKTDVLVIGGGLAGIIAAKKLKDFGRKVILVRKSYGATTFSSGAFDVSLSLENNLKNPLHPYTIINKKIPIMEIFKKAIDEFFSILKLNFIGSISDEILVFNLYGTYKKTNFIQSVIGNHKNFKNILFLGINALAEFNAKFLSKAYSNYITDCMYIDFPGNEKNFNLSSLQLAKEMDKEQVFADFLKNLKNNLKGKFENIILPPILGIKNAEENQNKIKKEIDVNCFEILSFLPSVAGFRLQIALDELLISNSIEVIEQEVISCRIKNKKIESVFLKNNEEIESKNFILATGKYFSGGIKEKDEISETIFNLPVQSLEIFSAGLRINQNLQPIDDDGILFFDNLFACGGILSGYDYIKDSCGLGVALTTGYLAGENAGKI